MSGHGFGHSAREIEVLRHLPETIPLVVKTTAPEWFWRRELTRPFDFVPASFDVGCIQYTSLDVDISATLRAAQEKQTENAAQKAGETDDGRARNARVILTDVASFPFTIARNLGIPGVCVANFTWADIYAEYADTEPDFAPLVAELRAEYAQADLLLDADLSLPMPHFSARQNVGLITRMGTNQRDLLRAALPPNAQTKRLALVYLGNWGFEIPWAHLCELPDWHFVSLNDAPLNLSNWTTLSRDLLPHPALVASVDAVISKAGYGLVGECLAHGTPLLYPARENFAEYAALHNALSSWAGGIFIRAADWQTAHFAPYLARVLAHGAPPVCPAPGGKAAAQIIAALWRKGQKP